MKKILILILALLMTLSPAALAASSPDAPVNLDYTTIIAGDTLYYSGSVDGGEVGVFMMNRDGSDPKKISDITADLLALSGENLLVYRYDQESGDVSLNILAPDGTLTLLEDIYSSKAIAADGRFYWGMGSCAEDGSDIQLYFTGDDANSYNYYPLAVQDGYYYYLDWSEMSGTVFYEGSEYPMGVALSRMNLADRTHEVISSVGTTFLGIEDGRIYYTRDNFWTLTEDGSDSAEVTVDRGLFAADLDTLTETRLASFPESDDIVTSYSLLQDGVIYGLHSDFSTDDAGLYSIARISADGTELPSIPLDVNAWISLHAVQGDTLYAAQSIFSSSEDDFIQRDCILAVNLTDGSKTPLNPDSIDMLFYTESNPYVVVDGDSIFYTAYDMERWSVCLKSMLLDGTDLRLLAYGVSSAEG